jgi:hypothetical protein
MATFTFQNSDGPYPLFPTTITPTSFEIRHRRTTLVSDGRSMRRQSRSVGGVRIEGTFRFPPLPTTDYATMIAFFRQLDGRSTTFAFRIPSLRTDNAADSNLRVGEYYNRSSTDSAVANQLVQYVGLSGSTIVSDPPARDTGTVALRTHAQQLPTLRCSLATDNPSVEYSDDGFVRVSLDVIERW